MRSAEGILLMRKERLKYPKCGCLWRWSQIHLKHAFVWSSSPPSFNCFLALSLLGVVLSLHCRGDNGCANENVTSILRSITNSVPIFLSISLLFNLAGLRCKNDTWKSYTLLAGAKPYNTRLLRSIWIESTVFCLVLKTKVICKWVDGYILKWLVGLNGFKVAMES